MHTTLGVREFLRTATIRDLPSQLEHPDHTHVVREVELVQDSTSLRCIQKYGSVSTVSREGGKNETENWDPYYAFQHYLKEQVVSEVDDVLQWGLVPTSVTRGDFALQVFITGKTLEQYAAKSRDKKKQRFACLDNLTGARIAVLDFICNQKDRSWKNMMIDPSGQVYCIDNELAFEPTYLKEADYVWELIDSRAVEWWYRNGDRSVIKSVVEDFLLKKGSVIKMIIESLVDTPHKNQLVLEMLRRIEYLKCTSDFTDAVHMWYEYAFRVIPRKRRLSRHV